MANFRIFGFSIGRDVKQNIDTPIAPSNLDSTTDISATMGGYISPSFSVLDIDNVAQNENQQIEQYRVLSLVPEVDKAIEEIVSEAIIVDKLIQPVSLNLDECESVPPKVKELIIEEHKEALRLLSFNARGHDIFRRWYIDGRINYQVLIDNEQPQLGIQELRFIDPKKIKRIRELIKQPDPLTRTEIIKGIREYYLYSETGLDSIKNSNNAIQMSTDSIVYVHSGLHNPANNTVTSYLQNALRPANNLRMMEDSMVIYRLSRASEKRVFKIATGSLQKGKAEQYVQEIADKYRNKIVYDASTGSIKNDKRYMAMTEDYWLPVGDNGSGTTIETLEGGAAVGETGEADYFKQKLYEALRVPSARMTDQPTLFSSGTEITRDEVRFARFVAKLRKRFAGLFIEIIRRNLVLKGIMSDAEFEEIEDSIYFDYVEDNYFSEAMEYNIIQQRMSVLQLVDPYVGKYVSQEYVFKNILKLTEEEQQEMMEQIQFDQERMLQQEIQQEQARIKAGITPDPVAESIVEEKDEPVDPMGDRALEVLNNLLSN